MDIKMGHFFDMILDMLLIGKMSGVSLPVGKTEKSETSQGTPSKEKEVPTNIFTKEDEAVFAQVEPKDDDFETLSKLYDVLEPFQTDDFRYYIVKLNQRPERVLKTRKRVKTGATQKGPEKDELYEEFETSMTANLYGDNDVRTLYLKYIARKIRDLDGNGGNGAVEMKRLLIKRRLIRAKTVQQEAKEQAEKAKEASLNAAYWNLIKFRLRGGLFESLVTSFGKPEEEAIKDKAFHQNCLRAIKDKADARKAAAAPVSSDTFADRISGWLKSNWPTVAMMVILVSIVIIFLFHGPAHY